MWAQTFIYYLLLQSKDKGNEDDYTLSEEKKTDEPDRPDWTVHLPQRGPHTTHKHFFDIFWINNGGVCPTMPYLYTQSYVYIHFYDNSGNPK